MIRFIVNKYMLRLILGLSLIVKVVAVFILHDRGLSNEWLVLFNNFEKLNIYSYYNLEGQNIPSSYMPPFYLMFIYISKFLSFNLFNFIYLLYFFQIILSTVSVILFFKLCNYFLDKKLSIIGATIFAFFPLLIFSNALISSACLQVFFYLLFTNFLIEIINEKKRINIILFSIVIVCCLLLRGEFLVILFLSLCYIIINNKKNIKLVLIVFFITLTVISPYLVRNYINTNTIHIVNVTGYALWKGNNHFAKVEGFHDSLHPAARENWPIVSEFDNLYQRLDNIKITKRYEQERDQVFFNEALDNITQDKKKYFLLYVKKIISYFFIDNNSSISNYYNLFHIVPNIVVAILAVPGIFLSYANKKDNKILYILMIMFSLIFLISIFYILPRYKISIIIFQILFSLFTLDHIYKKFIKKN